MEESIKSIKSDAVEKVKSLKAKLSLEVKAIKEQVVADIKALKLQSVTQTGSNGGYSPKEVACPVTHVVTHCIYTDGSCLGNPGKGGWGVIVFDELKEIFRDCGSQCSSTNNIMELSAMDNALSYVLRGGREEDTNKLYNIFTDSKYVKNGMCEWMTKWKSNDFMSSLGKPIKNKALWISIDKKHELLYNRIRLNWVKAHNGDERNELVDKLARNAAENQSNGCK